MILQKNQQQQQYKYACAFILFAFFLLISKTNI